MSTWEDAATNALGELFMHAGEGRPTDDELLDYVEHCVDVLHDGSVFEPEKVFRWIAESGLRLYHGFVVENENNTLQRVHETLCAKQHDYGHENIAWGGREGLVLRLHDKVARIKNLLTKTSGPTNESLSDSYLDVCGYGIIGMMWERGTFHLPLAADLVERVDCEGCTGDPAEHPAPLDERRFPHYPQTVLQVVPRDGYNYPTTAVPTCEGAPERGFPPLHHRDSDPVFEGMRQTAATARRLEATPAEHPVPLNEHRYASASRLDKDPSWAYGDDGKPLAADVEHPAFLLEKGTSDVGVALHHRDPEPVYDAMSTYDPQLCDWREEFEPKRRDAPPQADPADRAFGPDEPSGFTKSQCEEIYAIAKQAIVDRITRNVFVPSPGGGGVWIEARVTDGN